MKLNSIKVEFNYLGEPIVKLDILPAINEETCLITTAAHEAIKSIQILSQNIYIMIKK